MFYDLQQCLLLWYSYWHPALLLDHSSPSSKESLSAAAFSGLLQAVSCTSSAWRLTCRLNLEDFFWQVTFKPNYFLYLVPTNPSQGGTFYLIDNTGNLATRESTGRGQIVTGSPRGRQNAEYEQICCISERHQMLLETTRVLLEIFTSSWAEGNVTCHFWASRVPQTLLTSPAFLVVDGWQNLQGPHFFLKLKMATICLV